MLMNSRTADCVVGCFLTVSLLHSVLQAIVASFQRDASIPICLLTSQVGGLGLTLTAADRVILVDPSWCELNPNWNLKLRVNSVVSAAAALVFWCTEVLYRATL